MSQSLRRHGRFLVIILPALLGFGLTAIVVLAAVLNTPEQLVDYYIPIATKSFQNQDYQRARICFEKLLRLGWRDEETQWWLARTLQAQGETERAQAMMDRLAPLDKPGHPGAQLWQAQRLLSQTKLAPEGFRDAETHLRRVLETDPKSIEAHALLGQMYATMGRAEEARPHLEVVVIERPELLLHLAAVLSALRNDVDARSKARSAVEIYRKRAEEHPDDHEARLRWAAATLFLEDYAGAEAILQQALARGEAPEFHKGLAVLYQTWADALAKDSHADAGAWLTLLERGLRHDPTNPDLLHRLASVMNNPNAAEAERARAALKSLLAEGQATATVHYLLGLDAWKHSQPDAAQLHWERAHKMAPELDVVTNNLAWALASDPDPDLPRALDLINQVLGHVPDQPSFLSTRGHILVRMKRWKEALADLEAALPGERQNPDVHRDLASTYTAMGLPDLASEHERLAVPAPAPSSPPADPAPAH